MCLCLSHSIMAKTFQPLTNFGSNPGELNASYLVDDNRTQKLILVLHGCGQSAENLARNSGLVNQAKQQGFAVLAIQQQASNNATTCFNWFSKTDQLKNSGETLSIMNMVAKAKVITGSQSVYVIGLSAGGAMASSLLAQYPEEFKAGAVVAGIPFPCANNLIKAISCMKSGTSLTAQQMANEIQDKQVKWPDLIVIAGNKDAVVNPSNASLMARQWQLLKSLSKTKKVEEQQYSISRWNGVNGQVTLIEIAGMTHGFPINGDKNNYEKSAPFILNTSFSTVDFLVESWIKLNKS